MLIGVEAGGIVGFMGRNVLGQYELALLDPERPPRLLLVAPNLREAARTFEADEAELLEWVVFHEITHAVQFTGVPWLREHLAAMLRELLSSVKVEVDPAALLRLPKLQDLRAAWDAVREGGLVHAVAGPERKEIIDRLQAIDGAHRGPRRARHGRRRRGGAARRCPSCASRSSAGGARSRRWSSCSSACSASTSRCASTSSASASATRSCATGGSRASTAPGALRSNLPTLAELDDPAAWVRQNACSFCNTRLLAVYKHVFAWYVLANKIRTNFLSFEGG